MSSSKDSDPAASRSADPSPYDSSTPANPSDGPPGQSLAKRKRPDAPSATNNQGFVNSVVNGVNSIPRRYDNPTTYPMNRTNPVDTRVAAAQLRAANMMFHQQGNAGHSYRHGMSSFLQNINFANLHHPQQYGAPAFPSDMAPAPAATQRVTPPLGNLQPTATPRPADNRPRLGGDSQPQQQVYFANASQHAVAALQNTMAPPPAGNQRNGALPPPLAPVATSRPADNAPAAPDLPPLDNQDTTSPPVEPGGGGLEGVDSEGEGVQDAGDMEGDIMEQPNSDSIDSSGEEEEEEIDDLSISYLDEQSNIEATGLGAEQKYRDYLSKNDTTTTHFPILRAMSSPSSARKTASPRGSSSRGQLSNLCSAWVAVRPRTNAHFPSCI